MAPTKYPINHLRERSLSGLQFGAGVEDTVHHGGEPRETEPANHIVPTVRKQSNSVDVFSWFSSFLNAVLDLSQGVMSPSFRVVLLTPINLVQKIPHGPAQRFVSKVIQDHVKLPIYINQHRYK